MTDLYKFVNYTVPLQYCIATNIYEYDIQKANINVLYSLGKIDIHQYNAFMNMTRMQRQVTIGKMIRDDNVLYKELAAGIIEYKKKLFIANDIQEAEVMSIKNDAVFTTRILNITEFDNIKFVLKNSYTSFIKLKSLEVYFRSDQINGIYVIDVKGIKDELLELHTPMIYKICDILYLIESGDIVYAMQECNNFYTDYISRKLPVSFYRELTPDGKYHIDSMTHYYFVPEANQTDINKLDISYNASIIRQLYQYLCEMYFSRQINRRG